MIGAIVRFFLLLIKQNFCLHEYKTDPMSLRLPMAPQCYCIKCERRMQFWESF